MECHELQEMISAYLDHEVSEEERIAVEAHLNSCALCRGELESTKSVKSLVKRLAPLEAPPGLWTRIESAIAKDRVVPFAPRFFRMLASVAAMIAMFIGSVTFMGYHSAKSHATTESNMYLSSHAYHLMREPLADHSAWSYMASESGFELASEEQ